MKTNKKQLMQRAHALNETTSKPMAACMSYAWDLARLQEALLTREMVHITYMKKDGTFRKALGTLKLQGNANRPYQGRGSSPKVVTYWDIEKGDFRCFKTENLVSWY